MCENSDPLIGRGLVGQNESREKEKKKIASVSIEAKRKGMFADLLSAPCRTS